jgi:hypothetical protein
VTLFEYITVAVSIVLALAIARTIDGLRSSLAPDRRYWIHATWVAVKLTNPITFWWGIWLYRDVSSWNLLSFMVALAWPAVLYLQVTGLVTRRPEDVTNWRAHFYNQRRWFFGANTCLALLTVALTQILAGELSASPFNIARLVVLAYSIVGIATDNAKVHGFIVVCAAANLVLGYWAQMFSPLSSLP